MKKTKLLGLLLVSISACLWGCGKNDSGFAGQNGQVGGTYESVQVLPSPDKYTYYVKNYVGQNLASIGYSSFSGDIMDRYDMLSIRIRLINADGSYIDINDTEDLKKYVVIEQMPTVNTEFKITYKTDAEGNEYDGVLSSISLEEIVLLVDEVGTKPNKKATLTVIPADVDKHHNYVKDYTGRNLGNFGYVSWEGDLRDYYGAGDIKLNIVTDDGSYIDFEDESARNDYIVVSQDIPAGTEIEFTYRTDSEGNEFNYVYSMTYDTITLYVKKIK